MARGDVQHNPAMLFFYAWVAILGIVDLLFNSGHLPGGTISHAAGRFYASHPTAQHAFLVLWMLMGIVLHLHFRQCVSK